MPPLLLLLLLCFATVLLLLLLLRVLDSKSTKVGGSAPHLPLSFSQQRCAPSLTVKERATPVRTAAPARLFLLPCATPSGDDVVLLYLQQLLFSF